MSEARPSARRRSRQVALQVLYALDLSKGGEADGVFETFADHFELPEGARSFAKELVAGVAQQRIELDEAIAGCSRNWRLERMAAVDRNVLRLGAFEIRFMETPPQVAIDEAVELARHFGGDNSPRFVNGVLDALAAAEASP